MNKNILKEELREVKKLYEFLSTSAQPLHVLKALSFLRQILNTLDVQQHPSSGYSFSVGDEVNVKLYDVSEFTGVLQESAEGLFKVEVAGIQFLFKDFVYMSEVK